MPLVAASITKSMPFQGVGERFSNVYHYDAPTADAAVAAEIINSLVAAERRIHAAIVTFEEARVWSAGGTPAQNETLLVEDLTGPGEEVTDGPMYRECCWIVTWKTERPSATGKPVHLRKFLHTASQYEATPIQDITNGQQKIGVNGLGVLQTYEGKVRQLFTPNHGTMQLTAPSGRVAANAGIVLPYLQHHEYRY